MGLLKDLGDWLETVATDATKHTVENADYSKEEWSDAEIRQFERSSDLREVGRFLNGKTARDGF